MTKFEEEVDKVAKQAGYESLSLLIGDCEEANKIYIHFKNRHSDEEFQELKEEYSNQAESILLMLEEIKSLKSQLQQQALPVVPDFVDKFLKSKPIFNIVKYPIPIEIISWANKQTGYMDLEINITCLSKLKTNGYQVEKQKLFYLKNKLTGLYLACDAEGYLETGRTVAGKFTQAEIDSMQTGSYEQIEV